MKKLEHLMRKDWRVNRATVIGLMIAIILPYFFTCVAYFWDRYTTVVVRPAVPAHFEAVPVDIEVGAPLVSYLRTAAVAGMVFAVLAAAVLGGGAFALERREKSADFLAMLPVRREKIIASKLLMALSVLAAAMALEVGVLLCSGFSWEWETLPQLSLGIFNFVAAGLVMFGIAWLISTFLSSTAIATCVAIVISGCIALSLSMMLNHLSTYGPPSFLLACLVATTGTFFILIGSIYYTRRVAP
ncbi:MAG TPA: ABC transporter permease subunit [Tepidisphaeraceae bacterium]